MVMKDLTLVVGVIMLTVFLLFATPMAFIWGVNTLFGLSIPYDLKHLFAAWVVLFATRIVTRTEVQKK